MDAILYFNQTLALSAGNKPCIPIGTTTDQLLSNVVNYLRAHPEERHLNFMLLAMKATNNTWHCGEGRAQ
jgi:Rap1a immunity proteins